MLFVRRNFKSFFSKNHYPFSEMLFETAIRRPAKFDCFESDAFRDFTWRSIRSTTRSDVRWAANFGYQNRLSRTFGWLSKRSAHNFSAGFGIRMVRKFWLIHEDHPLLSSRGTAFCVRNFGCQPFHAKFYTLKRVKNSIHPAPDGEESELPPDGHSALHHKLLCSSIFHH